MAFFRHLGRHNTTRQFREMTLLCLICMLTLVLISSLLYVNVILNRNREYVGRIAEQYRGGIEQRANEAIQFVQTLAYDSVVSQYLREDDPFKRYEFSEQVSTFLGSMNAIQPQIRDAFLFRPDDSERSFLSLAPNQEAMLGQLSDCRLPVVLGFYPYRTATGEQMMLYVGCSIYDIDDISSLRRPIGAIAVAMSLSQIDEDLQELSQIPGISYAVLNNDMRLICGALDALDPKLMDAVLPLCHSHESGIRSRFLQEVMASPILGRQGTLLVYTNRAVLLKDMLGAVTVVLALTVLMYILLSYIFHIVRRSVTQPLTRLTEALAENTSTPLVSEGNEDIQTLTGTLNHLFEQERQLNDNLLAAQTRLYESELTQNRLELQFLRSQINPHFIYNALEVIRSISVVRKNGEVAQMAKSLASILRYSIKGGESVPLRDELAIIECYLSIQTVRFGTRFEYGIDVDPEVRGFVIPRMCLQPLVENAVAHGLEQKLDQGHLLISAFVSDSELVLVISDDGVGLPPERVKELNDLVKQPIVSMSPSGEGVGLINVARRIQIARGNEYGMRIESAPNRGTTVTLKLPIRKEE